MNRPSSSSSCSPKFYFFTEKYNIKHGWDEDRTQYYRKGVVVSHNIVYNFVTR